MDILDTATKPDFHLGSTAMRKAQSQKLDETTDWQLFVSRLGIRMKGLRILDELIFDIIPRVYQQPQKSLDPIGSPIVAKSKNLQFQEPSKNIKLSIRCMQKIEDPCI